MMLGVERDDWDRVCCLEAIRGWDFKAVDVNARDQRAHIMSIQP